MPDTLIQKILRGRSAGEVTVGDIVSCDVDLAVLIDIQVAVGVAERRRPLTNGRRWAPIGLPDSGRGRHQRRLAVRLGVIPAGSSADSS